MLLNAKDALELRQVADRLDSAAAAIENTAAAAMLRIMAGDVLALTEKEASASAAA